MTRPRERPVAGHIVDEGHIQRLHCSSDDDPVQYLRRAWGAVELFTGQELQRFDVFFLQGGNDLAVEIFVDPLVAARRKP